MVQPNESFRSSSANPAERRSVEDSFAKSVLWGFTVAAESNGHVLVDATDFVLRDGHGAATSLRPGTYRVDRARSAVYMPRTKAFPKNSEIEVTLTFANDSGGGRGGFGGGPAQGPPAIGAGGGRGGRGGGFGGGLFSGTVASVTPTADAVTLREHYSLGRTARRQFPAALRRSARRLRRTQLRRLQRAHRRTDGQAIHSPPPAGEERSQRGYERSR